MNKYNIKILVLIFLTTVFYFSCQKDETPTSSNDDKPPRPTTGEAILTGQLYYDYYEQEPAKYSEVFVFFYNDYTDTLARVNVDSSGKYYIENLPEDTVDVLVAQHYFADIFIASKIWDIPLKKGLTVADKEGIWTNSYIKHFKLVTDHFVVKYDSNYTQSQIDSFNALNGILSNNYHISLLNYEYYFLEIDSIYNVLDIIELYLNSDFVVTADPVFYDVIRDQYLWSAGYIYGKFKSWVDYSLIKNFADYYSLDLIQIGDDYRFYLTKNTKVYQEKLRMIFKFSPINWVMNVYMDFTFEYEPPPWE